MVLKYIFKMKQIFSFTFFLLSGLSYGQCAMCKAVVESGDIGMAEGLNDGIMYLMIFPYILVAALGYTLYRYKQK